VVVERDTVERRALHDVAWVAAAEGERALGDEGAVADALDAEFGGNGAKTGGRARGGGVAQREAVRAARARQQGVDGQRAAGGAPAGALGAVGGEHEGLVAVGHRERRDGERADVAGAPEAAGAAVLAVGGGGAAGSEGLDRPAMRVGGGVGDDVVEAQRRGGGDGHAVSPDAVGARFGR
jgi:hypothetical protein